MKKTTFLTFLLCLFCLSAKAQAFQEYLALFPTLTTNVVWTGDDLEKARKTGKNIPVKVQNFINGQFAAVGTITDYCFPIGKLEIGGTFIVFFAQHSLDYQEIENTQISLNARVYDKKGKILGGGIQNYMASNGGVPNRFSYSFVASLDFKARKLVLDQTASDKSMEQILTYRLTKKGFDLESNKKK